MGSELRSMHKFSRALVQGILDIFRAGHGCRAWKQGMATEL